MKGSFTNKEDCIKELRNQGFVFSASENGVMYFYSKEKQELAEVIVHSDNSASTLIGKYSS